MEKVDIVHIAREISESAPDDVVAVYLYGSRARGTASSVP
jgi:predicted nucleotidyltransferase